MKDIIEELHSLCGVIEDEISAVNAKLAKAGGNLSGDDVSYIDKLTHALKSIKSTISMSEEGYSGMMYPRYYGEDRSYADGRSDGRSYARGRRNARRDSMGRYSRGYSMATEDMADELRDLMKDAPDEQTKREFRKFIDKIESM
jgi:hypothetical protein